MCVYSKEFYRIYYKQYVGLIKQYGIIRYNNIYMYIYIYNNLFSGSINLNFFLFVK